MRGISKKMLISILTSVIVMVTMVATTFAWVGIFTYANTDNFKLNLKVVDLDSSYYLTISSTGEKGSFSDSVSEVQIKRSILKTQYSGTTTDIDFDEASDSMITSYFQRYTSISPCSPIIEDDNIKSFQKIDLATIASMNFISAAKDYYCFDLYLSVDAKEGINEETEINSNVFLSQIENTLSGTISKHKLINDNYYEDLVLPSTVDPLYDRIKLLKNMPQGISIDSKNAARFALELYNPIDINSDYTNTMKPIKTTIYQGGTQEPSYDSNSDIYCLGGNLPEDYNTAIKDLLVVRPAYVGTEGYYSRELYLKSIEEACNRNDLELIEANNSVWKKNYDIDTMPYLGVHNGVQTKMKVRVYFWFEGWDSDCLKGIDKTTSGMNLVFTSGTED